MGPFVENYEEFQDGSSRALSQAQGLYEGGALCDNTGHRPKKPASGRGNGQGQPRRLIRAHVRCPPKFGPLVHCPPELHFSPRKAINHLPLMTWELYATKKLWRPPKKHITIYEHLLLANDNSASQWNKSFIFNPGGCWAYVMPPLLIRCLTY